MNNLRTKTVADFMVENIAASEVFKKYGINYSSNTNSISLENLCHRHHLEYEKIIAELKALDKKVPYLKDYNAWDLGLLINFLKEIDHPFEKDNIIFIEKLINKILIGYGKQFFELEKIAQSIKKISSQVQNHVRFEEEEVFPYILHLTSYEKASKKPFLKELFLPKIVEDLKKQHKISCDLWKEMKELTKHSKPFEDVDTDFKLFHYKINQFEEKLHNHIHVESNILFAKALELEKKFLLT